MKALVYNGPKKMVFKNVPEPEAGPSEVKVRIDAVGICGSDMHAYLGHDERRPAPLILGHEAAGVIESGLKTGQRVVVNPLVSCAECLVCISGRPNLCSKREIISMPPRPGAFAEKLVIPERNLIAIPDHLDISLAALAEPLATSWHAVVSAGKNLSRPIGESNALVIGGGAVGLGAALVLRSFGCSAITLAETNPLRRKTAENAGFDKVINPAGSAPIIDDSCDLVIDAVGNKPTRKMAVKSIRPGGVIVHIGLSDGEDGLDARKLTLQEISLIGSYTYTPNDFQATVNAMANGSLGALNWTEHRTLKEGPQAFQDLLAGKLGAAKVVLVSDNA